MHKLSSLVAPQSKGNGRVQSAFCRPFNISQAAVTHYCSKVRRYWQPHDQRHWVGCAWMFTISTIATPDPHHLLTLAHHRPCRVFPAGGCPAFPRRSSSAVRWHVRSLRARRLGTLRRRADSNHQYAAGICGSGAPISDSKQTPSVVAGIGSGPAARRTCSRRTYSSSAPERSAACRQFRGRDLPFSCSATKACCISSRTQCWEPGGNFGSPLIRMGSDRVRIPDELIWQRDFRRNRSYSGGCIARLQCPHPHVCGGDQRDPPAHPTRNPTTRTTSKRASDRPLATAVGSVAISTRYHVTTSAAVPSTQCR
jgi:hypothetical protein